MLEIMTKKPVFTNVQLQLIEMLKTGISISYFRGIGTRYAPCAHLEDANGQKIVSVNINTVRALRNKNTLEEFNRTAHHSKYKLKS